MRALKTSGDRSRGLQRTFTFLAAAIIPLLERGIGGMFLLSGIGKALALNAFRETVLTLTGMPELVGSVLALAVIAIELLCGTGLVIQRGVRIASTVLALLLSLFLVILVSAVYQNTDLPCNCFGILDVSLSMPARIILDFLLLNALTLFILVRRNRDRISRRMRPLQMLSIIVCTIMLLYLETEIVLAAWSRSPGARGRALSTVISYIEKASPPYRSGGSNRALILLRFEDFNCPPCYDDFLLLSDSLRTALSTPALERVAGGVAASGLTPDRLQERLRQWKIAAGIAFPLLVLPDTLFSHAGIGRSTIAVLNSSGRTLFYKTLPIGPAARDEVVSLLSRVSSRDTGSP
ncbi:MAG: MauE/DoxX family redox-associated membrane protein [Bacteroidota bacterium]